MASNSMSEFCGNCGAILPLPLSIDFSNEIECRLCKSRINVNLFNGIVSHSKIVFNSREMYKKMLSKKSKSVDTPEGPTIERKCWRCGYERMSFATLQTRSADEGQTVFYTCVKCGAQENENS